MKFGKKQIIIGLVILVIAAIAIYYFFFKKPEVTETPAPITIPGVTPVTNYSTPAPFPLIVGSKGSNVKALQAAVNKIDSRSNLALDGVFGNMTKDSVQAFIGGSYYPVTEDKYNYIIQLANSK